MAREIKFRAWNRETKRMWWFDPRWGNTYNRGIGWVGMLPIGEIKQFTGGFTGTDNRIQVDIDDCELMQYTGLKDYKGQEIYEGDIVRQRRRNWTGKGAVVFDSGCYWFRRSVAGGQEELYIATTNDEVEVIGNIYENPELLGS